jgi:cell division septation protein DedD
MPRNEDGEFELVLANRQLLSVFFIVVILLGVFFTMGYMVGRSSAPVATADSGGPRRADPKPLVVDSAAPPAGETRAPETSARVVPPEPSKQPISTAPQQSGESAKSEPKPPPENVKAEPAKSAPPKTEPVRSAGSEPASGETYLQLVATAKAEADVMVDVLKKKGFNAIESAVPNKDGWFRVLVGPIAEGDVNKTKAGLQSAGFPGDKSIKKTF